MKNISSLMMKMKAISKTLIAIANALYTSADYFSCDNVVKLEYVFKEEANKLFLDCDDYEMRIIMNIILTTKESLRQEIDFRKRIYEV